MSNINKVAKREINHSGGPPKSCQLGTIRYRRGLQYELRDGTIGLAQPKNWREIVPAQRRSQNENDH